MSYPEQLEWGSFLPALVASVADTTGPVLEIGIGHFSTPILHALCGAMNKDLISVEDSPDWVWMKDKYGSKTHVFHFGSYDYFLPPYKNGNWGVVFIDNSPGGWRRLRDFEMFIDRSEVVVVHDYHRENEEAIAPVLKAKSALSIVTTAYQPPTLVASLTRLPKGL